MNQRYDAGRRAFGLARINWATQTIQAVLVSSLYRFNAGHRTLDAVAGRITDPVDLQGLSVDAEGYALANPISFPRVLADMKAVGCVVFKLNGPLIAFYDAINGFPLQPNGGDIDVGWPNNKLFRI